MIAERSQPLPGLGLADLRENHRRVAPLRLQNVVLRDDPRHRGGGGSILGHRKVMEVLLHHRGDERRQRGLLVHRQHGGAHDVGDERRNVPPLADDLRPKVRVGHDAEWPPLIVHDQDRPYVALAHQRRGVADGRVGSAGQHVAHGIDTTHVFASVPRPLVPPRRAHRFEAIGVPPLWRVRRKIGSKEQRHPRRLAKQLVELPL